MPASQSVSCSEKKDLPVRFDVAIQTEQTRRAENRVVALFLHAGGPQALRGAEDGGAGARRAYDERAHLLVERVRGMDQLGQFRRPARPRADEADLGFVARLLRFGGGGERVEHAGESFFAGFGIADYN